MSAPNSGMAIHTLAHKLTCSHFIVILFTLQCQLYISEQSHPFSCIVAFVYKLLHIPMHIHFQLVQQCDYIYQNKFFKCTYVHLCLFLSKPVQHIQHSTLGLLTHNATVGTQGECPGGGYIQRASTQGVEHPGGKYSGVSTQGWVPSGLSIQRWVLRGVSIQEVVGYFTPLLPPSGSHQKMYGW